MYTLANVDSGLEGDHLINLDKCNDGESDVSNKNHPLYNNVCCGVHSDEYLTWPGEASG